MQVYDDAWEFEHEGARYFAVKSPFLRGSAWSAEHTYAKKKTGEKARSDFMDSRVEKWGEDPYIMPNLRGTIDDKPVLLRPAKPVLSASKRHQLTLDLLTAAEAPACFRPLRPFQLPLKREFQCF